MSVEELPQQSSQPAATRSEVRFPAYDLASCLEVPRLLHVNGGGAATADHLASYLGYKGTKNGAFLAKLGAARAFGLIQKSGNHLVPSPLAHRIISPVYPTDSKQALVEAFFNIPLFQKIYEFYRGKELPSEFGMKNALRLNYGIMGTRVDLAYRTLIDSAETAGFFETKLGAKTHLILPMIQPSTNKPPEGVGDDPEDKGGGDDPPPPPPPPHSPPVAGDMKAQYLASLLKAFDAKSANGDIDEKLMERIERLLGVV